MEGNYTVKGLLLVQTSLRLDIFKSKYVHVRLKIGHLGWHPQLTAHSMITPVTSYNFRSGFTLKTPQKYRNCSCHNLPLRLPVVKSQWKLHISIESNLARNYSAIIGLINRIIGDIVAVLQKERLRHRKGHHLSDTRTNRAHSKSTFTISGVRCYCIFWRTSKLPQIWNILPLFPQHTPRYIIHVPVHVKISSC